MANYLARFGETIARSGIASIPDAIFSFQRDLNLSVGECWFVAQILRHKWTTELPRPSLRKMESYTGVSSRTLHNYKNSLVEKGYLVVVNRKNSYGGKATNYYDFSPLFDRIINLLDSKQIKANPIEEDSENGVCEDFSYGVCENFSHTHVKKLQHIKQKNIQTKKENNNPPAKDGGKDTRPPAGVVVELDNLFREITGRSKRSFFERLVKVFDPEEIRKHLLYMKEFSKRNRVLNPVGFLIRALEEKWETQTLDKGEMVSKRRIEETKELLKEYSENKRASPETVRKYLSEMREALKRGNRDGSEFKGGG